MTRDEEVSQGLAVAHASEFIIRICYVSPKPEIHLLISPEESERSSAMRVELPVTGVFLPVGCVTATAYGAEAGITTGIVLSPWAELRTAFRGPSERCQVLQSVI